MTGPGLRRAERNRPRCAAEEAALGGGKLGGELRRRWSGVNSEVQLV